jgi:multidrug efflux pump subunit AcrB
VTDPADTPDGPRNVRSKADLIGLFTRHPTAANLVMVLMVIAGLFGLYRMTTQFFPDFGIDIVTVTVDWPGASAADVDDNIVQPIDREVRFIDNVKRVRANAFEGRAVIAVEFEAGTDMQSALNNVETAVKRVTTLPADSETPVIQRVIRYDTLSRLIISGPYSERSLKAIAKRIRDGLLRRGIDKVDIGGARDEEILVEVEPATLRRLNLTIDGIAKRIRQISQDIPSGDLRGRAQRQLRSIGEKKTARDIGKIEIKSLPGGQKLLLRDIAKVTEAFDEHGFEYRHNGHRAIELHIQRSTTGDALALSRKVVKYLAELKPTLPPNISIVRYDVQANLIRSRISLLLRNGASGLVVVVLILFLFLNFRVALWVAVGIPVSMMATLVVMWATGQSIDMVSLFGLIMAIGIIVDDAIVVGEHSETLRSMGYDATLSAEAGARRMAAPVLSASLTTIAAFLPLLLISDIIGQIIRAIPLVVISVLIASLAECFFVLPGHMRHALADKARHGVRRSWASLSAGARVLLFPFRLVVLGKRGFNAAFDRFRDGPFVGMVKAAVRWRYATVATAVAALVVCLGLVMGGRVAFIFFPNPEVDNLFANVEFAAGTPRAKTEAMLNEMERAMRVAERKLTGGKGGLVYAAIQRIGTPVGVSPVAAPVEGDHVGGIFVQLIPTDRRTVTAAAFIRAWRKEVRPMAGLRLFTIKPARGGPPGRDVDVRLSGTAPAKLKKAAEELIQLIRTIPGVTDIEDNLPFGKREAILELTPRGKALGFTTETIGRDIRNAFEGAIARRIGRGDEEVKYRVRLAGDARDSAGLHALYLRSPAGVFVPLDAVVTLREKNGFARIKREAGAREVAVVADINTSQTSTDKVIATLLANGLKRIARKYGAEYRFEGRAREQARTFKDMEIGAVVGIALIYIILAWMFASYVRPIVVMSIIPLGFVGTVIGHLVLGFDLTILSMIALVGLSGIVVNDSIILVTTIKERLENGEPLYHATINGARDRLRAVMLTSLTTIGGLAPLMFETDLQAQFLIPMAITLVFGLMVTTLLVLFVIPALIAIQDDFGRVFRRRRAPHGPTTAPAG